MTTLNLKTFFERCYCVNLARRKDRWKQFTKNVEQIDWPFADIERYNAIDAKKVHRPDWWTAGGGAWGCYSSHLDIIQRCINENVESVLLMEDDAIFPKDFTPRVTEYLEAVPDDWQMIYLGGQHLKVNKQVPTKINDQVTQPYNVNRTHAFAIRGSFLNVVYKHLLARNWHKGNHIDHHLGRIHQQRDKYNIYTPMEWLVGQREGKSNISGRKPPTRFWRDAKDLIGVDPKEHPFVAILGLHGSGSSTIAGVLYHLGAFHLGNQLGGYHGTDPDTNCGFEAVGLMHMCERFIPFPTTGYKLKRTKMWSQLQRWINEKRREAANGKKIAAGKYPQMCRLGDQLKSICGDNLLIVNCDRSLEASIESIQRRCPKRNPEFLAKHQRWLWDGKNQLINDTPPERVLHVSYDNLVENTEDEVAKIVEWFDLADDDLPQRIKRACDYVKPTKRNVQ